MKKEDKIFEQFKNAANNAEQKDFPGMDRVWSSVEGKLDQKILTKENTLLKNIAVVASVLLVVSLGYHFLKDDKKTIVPKTEIVIIDTVKIKRDSVLNPKNTVTFTAVEKPIILHDSVVFQESDIFENDEVQIVRDSLQHYIVVVQAKTLKSEVLTFDSIATPIRIPENTLVASAFKFDSTVVKNNVEVVSKVTYVNDNKKQRQKILADKKTRMDLKKRNKRKKVSNEKEKPLLVIDNKAESLQKLNEIDPTEIEEIRVLNEPLYIINGVEYSEQEVFGPKPTSPYSPLDKQKIETVSILQDEEAVSKYGDKGKKGVVIITTKDGKPAALKK